MNLKFEIFKEFLSSISGSGTWQHVTIRPLTLRMRKFSGGEWQIGNFLGGGNRIFLGILHIVKTFSAKQKTWILFQGTVKAYCIYMWSWLHWVYRKRIKSVQNIRNTEMFTRSLKWRGSIKLFCNIYFHESDSRHAKLQTGCG